MFWKNANRQPAIVSQKNVICLAWCLAICIATGIAVEGRPVKLDEGHQHPLTEKEVGSVQFDNSCSSSVQTRFQRAVALLHSFQYEQSRAEFTGIAEQDSQCAIAYWGIAMSHFHGLWHNGDPVAGRAAFNKAQEVSSKASSATDRERAYIDALSAIYQQDGNDDYSHAVAFEQKMAALQKSYPLDSEAAIFHALSLDIAASKTDRTFAYQRECARILEPIFVVHPNHPGVAHYLIHCYDNPVLAKKGIEAARRYAAIAPASPHANHMPSHIFTRVGLWEESIQSNLRSAELAKRLESNSTDGEARQHRLHAFDYLEYAYLQSGRVGEAGKVIAEMNTLSPIRGLTASGDYALAAIPARYALELSNWKAASRLQVRTEGVPWSQAITWMAVGIGAARSGDSNRASEAEATLAHLRDTAQSKSDYWSNQIEVQRREVAAWIAQSSYQTKEAITTMRSAAELEESMDKDAVTPGAIVPARELLADILQAQGKPQEALPEYEAVLRTSPNRFNALWGAAICADANGDISTALKYFRTLNEVTATTERRELQTVRKRLGPVARN